MQLAEVTLYVPFGDVHHQYLLTSYQDLVYNIHWQGEPRMALHQGLVDRTQREFPCRLLYGTTHQIPLNKHQPKKKCLEPSH